MVDFPPPFNNPLFWAQPHDFWVRLDSHLRARRGTEGTRCSSLALPAAQGTCPGIVALASLSWWRDREGQMGHRTRAALEPVCHLLPCEHPPLRSTTVTHLHARGHGYLAGPPRVSTKLEGGSNAPETPWHPLPSQGSALLVPKSRAM